MLLWEVVLRVFLHLALNKALFKLDDIHISHSDLSSLEIKFVSFQFVPEIFHDWMFTCVGLHCFQTRILVTHGISFLPQVDKIIVLANGTVSETGSFTELLKHNGAFAEFLRNYLTGLKNEDETLQDSEGEARLVCI